MDHGSDLYKRSLNRRADAHGQEDVLSSQSTTQQKSALPNKCSATWQMPVESKGADDLLSACFSALRSCCFKSVGFLPHVEVVSTPFSQGLPLR